jgi:lipoprotein NlpI
MIADALGKHDEARSDLQQALQINPHFHLVYAGAVEEKLAAIETESASKEGANHHAL